MNKIWKTFVANFDTILAILVSIFAAVFGIFGGNQTALLAGIATVLGLLAYGIIRDRYARESLGINIQNLENAVNAIASGKTKASSFFVRRGNSPALGEFLRSSTETIDILGSSLISIGTIHQATLRELKEKGCKIRIVAANPENQSLLELIAKRYKEVENAAVAKHQIVTSLSSLVPLVGKLKNGGSLTIKLINCFPTFSYISIDAKKPNGKSQVEFALNQTGVGRNPIFIIESLDDNQWFSEFQNQFEFLWNSSDVIDETKFK